jgi:hypothetical protein
VEPTDLTEEDENLIQQVEHDDDYILENRVNVSARFRYYNAESDKKNQKSQDFFVDVFTIVTFN